MLMMLRDRPPLSDFAQQRQSLCGNSLEWPSASADAERRVTQTPRVAGLPCVRRSRFHPDLAHPLAHHQMTVACVHEQSARNRQWQ